MISSISRLIRWASVTRQGKDDKKLPIQQIGYLGKVADCVMVFPYGMHANVDGDALTLMFAVGGDDDNKAGIPTSGTRRQQLAPGEVMVYSPVTGASVVFKAAGSVDVAAPGDINATAGGNMNATATAVNVTAPTVAVTGNVIINGALTVNGVATVGALASTGGAGSSSFSGNLAVTTGNITINGKPIDGHIHGGVTTGGGNTAAF